MLISFVCLSSTNCSRRRVDKNLFLAKVKQRNADWLAWFHTALLCGTKLFHSMNTDVLAYMPSLLQLRLVAQPHFTSVTLTNLSHVCKLSLSHCLIKLPELQYLAHTDRISLLAPQNCGLCQNC